MVPDRSVHSMLTSSHYDNDEVYAKTVRSVGPTSMWNTRISSGLPSFISYYRLPGSVVSAAAGAVAPFMVRRNL